VDVPACAVETKGVVAVRADAVAGTLPATAWPAWDVEVVVPGGVLAVDDVAETFDT
jgi:hypothetical protein